MLFLEGGIHPGDRVHRFHPALLGVAEARSAPVRAVCVGYETEPGEHGAYWTVGWWGGMPLARHELAARLEDVVRAHFRPLARDPRPPVGYWPEEILGRAAELDGRGSDARGGSLG